MNIDTQNTEWRTGDLEGKTFCVYRYHNGRVQRLLNASSVTKRFRTRRAAIIAAADLNKGGK